MKLFGMVLLFILLFSLGILAFLFGVQVIAWNVNDIADKGANFWNVFWIMLVAASVFGGTSKASSSNS